ncbi:hypothetical protein ACEWX3_24495 [Mycobacterium sp. G7A2]|uniref:hypothetical protein n=1 Tax=Mycobacterium sp. G7A2 TaxID=3317307 RepID=UPI0035A97D5F
MPNNAGDGAGAAGADGAANGATAAPNALDATSTNVPGCTCNPRADDSGTVVSAAGSASTVAGESATGSDR